jgi:hypothetical protein
MILYIDDTCNHQNPKQDVRKQFSVRVYEKQVEHCKNCIACDGCYLKNGTTQKPWIASAHNNVRRFVTPQAQYHTVFLLTFKNLFIRYMLWQTTETLQT